MTASKKIWIFDLDDTLHNASAHIFPVMNRAMTQFIMDELQLTRLRPANCGNIIGAFTAQH